MGYNTDFSGFSLSKPLTEAQALYLKHFSETRRMQRDAIICGKFPDPVRDAVGLPIGYEGEFFVGHTRDSGQERDSSVVNFNHPPAGQPDVWCKWEPTEDREGIQWSGAEAFYGYVEWLEYIVENFLKPWGIVLSGSVEFWWSSRRTRPTARR